MPRPLQHNQAVALCCDRGYLPYALFVIRQITELAPDRRFDIVLASQDALELPDWAKPLGIRLHRVGALPDVRPPERFKGSMAPFLRLLLPRELGRDYRRILYLDCDVFVEGGDFARVLAADMGQYAIAAARDAAMFLRPGHHAVEFEALGWPAYKYANSGVLLIDTTAYVESDFDRQAFAMYDRNAARKIYADQSLLNLVLKGQFAELSPVWNWQLAGVLPKITAEYPSFVQHLIGEKKPYLDADDERLPRFLPAYQDHFSAHDPGMLSTLPKRGLRAPWRFKTMVYRAARMIEARPIVSTIMASFGDPYALRF